MGAVGFDGFDAQVKLGGDLAGLASVADELKDFEFAIAELRDAGTGGDGVGVQELLDDERAHAIAQVNFATEHLAHGGHDFGGGLALS